MKIVADKNIPYLEGRLSEAELFRLPASAITHDSIKDADGLIVRTRTHCNAELLSDTAVKAISTATIGTDHLDLKWLEKAGIKVSNAPGCNAPGVALYVWNSLLRNGFKPAEHTLGVIGCGNVGSIIAQWGDAMGVRLLVCDPPRHDSGFKDRNYVDLDFLLHESDAVTLHTPLSKSGPYPTFHLLDAEKLRLLKPGSILVNAARGEVIDSNALCRAIEEGRIGRAIIDTWEEEPAISSRLLELAAVATPHIAGYSVEGKQRATRMALEAIAAALGIKADTSGLAGPYRQPHEITPERILGSFDPSPLTIALKSSAADFEMLRNSYPLHRELANV